MSTLDDIVARARETFTNQCAKDLPYATQHERHVLTAAFNNAITELTTELSIATRALDDTVNDNRRARAELDELRNLGKRHSFSATDPVCARCSSLAMEGGNAAQGRPAVEGDACSKCGAVVCVQREDETDAQFRARLRDPSNRT